MFENVEWYLTYYDDNNKYHATKYFQDINTLYEAKADLENQGYKRVTIQEFRY